MTEIGTSESMVFDFGSRAGDIEVVVAVSKTTVSGYSKDPERVTVNGVGTSSCTGLTESDEVLGLFRPDLLLYDAYHVVKMGHRGYWIHCPVVNKVVVCAFDSNEGELGTINELFC